MCSFTFSNVGCNVDWPTFYKITNGHRPLLLLLIVLVWDKQYKYKLKNKRNELPEPIFIIIINTVNTYVQMDVQSLKFKTHLFTVAQRYRNVSIVAWCLNIYPFPPFLDFLWNRKNQAKSGKPKTSFVCYCVKRWCRFVLKEVLDVGR